MRHVQFGGEAVNQFEIGVVTNRLLVGGRFLFPVEFEAVDRVFLYQLVFVDGQGYQPLKLAAALGKLDKAFVAKLELCFHAPFVAVGDDVGKAQVVINGQVQGGGHAGGVEYAHRFSIQQHGVAVYDLHDGCAEAGGVFIHEFAHFCLYGGLVEKVFNLA